jgi:hypothetical protein
MSNTSKTSVTIEVDPDLASRVRAAADLHGGQALSLAAVVAALLADAVADLDATDTPKHQPVKPVAYEVRPRARTR